MNKINIPRNYKIFFAILTTIAIVAGSLFYFKLASNDQDLIKTYIEAYFFYGEYNSFINVLTFNLAIFILIWLFGLSMFGSILIAFIYFMKVFLLSTSVSAIFSLQKSNGILKAFLYVFPNQVLSVLIYALLAIYSINFSFMFFKILLKKKDIDFKTIFKSYNKIFIILFLISIVVILYQIYLNPFIIKLVFE